MAPSTPGLIIAAPASGSGKTTVTLALLRCLRDRGVRVASAKVGPDYIDPGFHTAASGRTCYNLDSWAMRPQLLALAIERCAEHADHLIVEGVMGLFDGAADGRGSSADLARLTGWPVILVVDAQGMAASAAALVHGFASFQPDVQLAGVIFNRCGSHAHGQLLRAACAPLNIPVLGCLTRNPQLTLPERHLGLVQAQEHPHLEHFLQQASQWLAEHIDIDKLLQLACGHSLLTVCADGYAIPPLGQRIAIAQDAAFAFCYPLVLDGWQKSGATLSLFSPLADQAPDGSADAVYLPGGYPELYAGQLAANRQFLNGLHQSAQRHSVIFGECGGYMVLGQRLIDAQGQSHTMAGLLPSETSFAQRSLHLGYRQLTLLADNPLGLRGQVFRGHEFHFATLLSGEEQQPLFQAQDAQGRTLGSMGVRRGSVMGSFAHLIDQVSD